MQQYTVSLSGSPQKEMPAGGDPKHENSAPGLQPAWHGGPIPGAAAAPGVGEASSMHPQQQQQQQRSGPAGGTRCFSIAGNTPRVFSRRILAVIQYVNIC